MNVEIHIHNSKNLLDQCRESISEGNYETALTLSANVYEQVRELMNHIWRLHREKALAEHPPGENVR